jgi:hypothetical protein
MVDLMQIRQRRAFFDDYGSRSAEQAAILPSRGIRFSCPCCGYPTLAGRGTDEICELCWWEDDGQDDDQADEVWGGPNHDYSLNDARENFQMFGVKYPPQNDTRVGGPDSETVRGIKTELIGAFEAIMKEPSAGRLNELWEQVRILERGLEREMKLRGKASTS